MTVLTASSGVALGCPVPLIGGKDRNQLEMRASGAPALCCTEPRPTALPPSRRGRATERSEVAPALETKFLPFRVGQRQDSVPCRSFPYAGTTGLVRIARPTGSTAHLLARTGAVSSPAVFPRTPPDRPAVKRPKLSLFAASRFVGDVHGLPRHRVAPRVARRCCCTASRRRFGTPKGDGRLWPNPGGGREIGHFLRFPLERFRHTM